MKLRYKIACAVLLVLALTILGGALVVGHDSPCEAGPALPGGTATMKAAVRRCYGAPDVIRVVDVARPRPADNEVLVRIHAASLNALDWRGLRGEPVFIRFDEGLGAPKNPLVGVDYAGTVEAVGKNVTHFKPGDEVFGGTSRGTLAQYVSVFESGAIVPKPARLTFEEAAAIPVGAVTALQSLRDAGHLQAGQKVLINGATGAVGTFTVQIAKAMGAQVTAVCSTRNVELVRSLGADRVVDYMREDFVAGAERYDLVIDNVGNRSVLEYRRIMQPKGILVIVGAGKGKWLSPLKGVIQAMVVSPFMSQEAGLFIAHLSAKDLTVLSTLAQSGKMKSIIDRRYALDDTANAFRYVEEGHARGKVIITVPQDEAAAHTS